MAKYREDFVWIRPVEGCGSVQLDLAGRRVTLTRGQPAEALKSVWLGELVHLGSLELCDGPSAPAPPGRGRSGSIPQSGIEEN